MVGAGTASFNALEAIKELEDDPNVLIIGAENAQPYYRPPLSKQWWKEKDEGIYLANPPLKVISDDLEGCESGIGWLHSTVGRIDVEGKYVVLEDGTKISYGKLLLATGVIPQLTPEFELVNDHGRIHTFRSVNDFEKLSSLVKEDYPKTIVVIGGGFLGSELSVALADKVNVIQTFSEKGNLSQVLPEYLAKWTTEKLLEQGVNVLPDTFVTKVDAKKNNVDITLSDGSKLSAHHVVVTGGAIPNIKYARRSTGLEVDKNLGGILVNAELLARSNIWAAGDIASYYDEALGRRRLEHQDHAEHSGRVAGANMTGKVTIPYTYQPMFWSDLGPDVSIEGVGNLDSKSVTVAIWAGHDNPSDATSPAYEKGIVFYAGKSKLIEGVLLWNVQDQVSVGRRIIHQGKTIDDIPEISKWFKLY